MRNDGCPGRAGHNFHIDHCRFEKKCGVVSKRRIGIAGKGDLLLQWSDAPAIDEELAAQPVVARRKPPLQIFAEFQRHTRNDGALADVKARNRPPAIAVLPFDSELSADPRKGLATG